MLTTRAIERQLDILAEGLELDPARDQTVAWLPLSHDMGFFGCLMLSFAKGMRLAMSSPERFLRAPRTWFGDCARVQATMTVAPNFALDLAARAARRSPPPARFPMRTCILGGERIEATTLDAATAALGPYGLTPATLLPAYGLAEAVLAVTMARVPDPPTTLTLDGPSLARGVVCPPDGDARRLVAAGRPLRGVSVRIDGEEGGVGEICIRTPSLASGYVDNPEETSARFVGGELRTRDLGFVRDDELYVVGRLDDMLCVAGRNVWARDIEAAISSCGAARPGSAALVDVAGTRLVLLVEPPKGATDHEAVGCESSRVAVETAGLKPDECLVLPPGTLPKTPSGKIQRFRCRSIAANQTVEPLARVTL
jgi:acyl-CoA synthetase (AMP-forming)/AMP-acid ligase II